MPSSVINLYHGSTYLFDKIDVRKGKPYKDFGRGFYLTKVRSHAQRIAFRNKHLEEQKYRVNCEAYMYVFELNLNLLSNFKVKEFRTVDFDWLEFVIDNRIVRDRAHNYDIVIGPTADDDTMLVINAYLDGLYGEVGSDRALDTLLQNIEAENLPGQFCFLSNEAAAILEKKGQAEIL